MEIASKMNQCFNDTDALMGKKKNTELPFKENNRILIRRITKCIIEQFSI